MANRISMARMAVDEAAEVRSWLDESGYSAAEPGKSVDGLTWALNVSGKPGITFLVGRKDDAESSLIVQRRIAIAPDHRKRLNALEAKAFAEFRFGLVRDLLVGGHVEYQIEGKGQDMEFIGFQTTMFDGELSRPRLLRALQEVLNASLLAIIHVRRAVGEPV